MDESLMELLRCPECKGELELEVRKRDDTGEVLEGKLRCPACPYTYPIEDGIPNLLPPELQEEEKAGQGEGKEATA